MTELNDRLLAAHAAGDKAALVELYVEAADATEDMDASCFFLTHAMVFALELGLPEASEIRERLVCVGREAN